MAFDLSDLDLLVALLAILGALAIFIGLAWLAEHLLTRRE